MRGLSTFLFVVFANTAFAQSFDTSDTHNVKWQQGPLTVDNFHVVDTKEKNPDSTHYGAFATGRVPYRYSYRQNHLVFWIQTYFDYGYSWMQKKEVKNRHVLNHAQRHFDLLEIEARNFAKVLRTYPFTDNFQNEIPLIYKSVVEDMKRMFKLYDERTKQGRNSEDQKAWDAKIDEYLHTLPAVDGIPVEIDVQ